MNGNQRRWSTAMLAEFATARRATEAQESYRCPRCGVEAGLACMTAAGSTAMCPERVALVPEQRRNRARR